MDWEGLAPASQHGQTRQRVSGCGPSLQPLRHRLRAPQDTDTATSLRARWFQVDITLIIAPERPLSGLTGADIAALPQAADRLRGGIGRALMATASPQALADPPQPCPWMPPCALDVMWGPMGRVRPGVEIPSPIVVRLDPRPLPWIPPRPGPRWR